MATLTKELWRANDEFGSSAVIQIDYDDVRLLLTAVRCINNTAFGVFAKAVVLSNGRNFSTIFPANTITTQNIPTGQTTRFDITVDARGRVDGVDYWFSWPA